MRTIAAMHCHHGTSEGNTCRDCCNLVGHQHAKQYYKCAAYGISASMATDWRLKWDACGLYNVPFDETKQYPLIHVLQHSPKDSPAGQCDGQITLEDFNAGTQQNLPHGLHGGDA